MAPTKSSRKGNTGGGGGRRAPARKGAAGGKAKTASTRQTKLVESLPPPATTKSLRRKPKGPGQAKPVAEPEDEDDDRDNEDGHRQGGKEVKRGKTQAHAESKCEGSDQDDSAADDDDHEDTPSRQQRPSRATAGRPSRGQQVDPEAVLTGSYLLAAGNSSELSRRLKQTWVALQQTPNQQHEESVPLEKLRLVCSELLHDKIAEHAETNVRSLMACCLVELLRVYAPDMPFKSNEELYDAFQLILEQLRNLANEDSEENVGSKTSSTDLHYLYILESLATVKSCLLLIGMDYTPDDAEEPLMVQLFRTLFNTIRKEHSVKVENLMLSVMASCVEESETIDQPLLDVILAPLVHANVNIESTISTDANSTDSSERGPYHMAQELVRRTSDQLQSHLSHFFNSILVDAPTTLSHKASELKEHVYTLIYEVHKVNPSLLLYVLPNVCMQLQVDEIATRSEAIALMGRLFASTHADYGHEFMKNFRDFLGRFRDVSKEIRLQMVQVSAIIWQRKPELASSIEKEFIQRLSDPEWEVRRLVVNEVCDLAANNLEAVSEECLRQVGERMKDKKVVLRKETMTGLSQVYAAHISSYWDGEEGPEISLANSVPTTNAKKLGWVPDFVLKCYAYPQQDLKLRVIQLLDDIMLPKALAEDLRAKGLLYIFHGLDVASKEAMRRILNDRAKCQKLLSSFLKAKKSCRGRNSGDDNTASLLSTAKEALLAGLGPMFNETDNLGKVLDQLVKWKDQSVFKYLETLCGESTSQLDTRSARDQLIKSVGSKSPLGEFLKSFCRRLNNLTISQGGLTAYFQFVIDMEGQYHKENRSLIELLLMVARCFPHFFAPFVRDEFETILVGVETGEDKDDESRDADVKLVIGLLHVLSLYSHSWMKQQVSLDSSLEKESEDYTPSAKLKDFLCHCCLVKQYEGGSSNEDMMVSKFAATILADFYGHTSELSSVVPKLCSKKMLQSPQSNNISSTLQSIGVFVKRCPQYIGAPLFSSMWNILVDDFIHQKSSAVDTAKSKKTAKSGLSASKAADIRCLAIKVVSRMAIHSADDSSVSVEDKCGDFVKLLFDVLRSDGRMWGTTGALPVKYRIAASSALLRLIRSRIVETSLKISEWHILGFVMQDSSDDVRNAFVKKLTSNLMKHNVPHPHKYLSYLALAATETNLSLKKTVRGLLIAAVERMRRMFEVSRQSSGPIDDEDDEQRQNIHALMVPEYALPYVIHILTHHPDYPVDAAMRHCAGGSRTFLLQDASWNDQVAYLSFFFDGLISTTGSGADNIALLLQILTKLSDCHDVTDATNNAMYPLLECAVGLLKRRIKNQSNLKAFPGKIYLPKQLFGSGKTVEERSSNHLIDQPPRQTTQHRGPRISTSLSPIKPSGTLDTYLTMSSPPQSAQKRRASPSSTSSRRKSLKSGTPSKNLAPETPTTPNRRQSLMRKARAQTKTYVEQSSDEDDDEDAFVPSASVASRVSKRDSFASVGSSKKKATDLDDEVEAETPPTPPSVPKKRSRGSTQRDDGADRTDQHERNGDDDDNDMPSFRASRRRRRS